MKQILPLLFSFILLSSVSTAQAPGSFSYQAVVRNDQSQAVTNQQVSMRISLLRGTATGQVIYSEEHSPSTTSTGKVSLKIGKGTTITGDFSGIDWSNGPYFVKVELDETGGSNYKNMGTSQLLSVPYALQAKKAENIFSGQYSDLKNAPDSESLVDTTMTTLWDKDYTDDFSGNYDSLMNKPDLSDTSAYLTHETDPVYDTSVAAGITQHDTIQWGKKQPVYWEKEADTLQYPEDLVKIGSDTTNQVDLWLLSNEDDSPGNSNISLVGNTSTLNLFAQGSDPKHASLNFRIEDTLSFIAYTSSMKLLRIGQDNNDNTLFKGINISYHNDVGIDTLADEKLHVNGAVRVEDTTSSPNPKTMYGNSMPLAYGYIESDGVQPGSYGIEQAALSDYGEYKVYLDNAWKSNPIVNVTPIGSYPGDDYSATYEFNAPNEITVYLVDSELNPLSTGFSIVVYGKPQ